MEIPEAMIVAVEVCPNIIVGPTRKDQDDPALPYPTSLGSARHSPSKSRTSNLPL